MSDYATGNMSMPTMRCKYAVNLILFHVHPHVHIFQSVSLFLLFLLLPLCVEHVTDE